MKNVLALVLFLIPNVVFSQEFSKKQIQGIKQIYEKHNVVVELADQKIITHDEAQNSLVYYGDQLRKFYPPGVHFTSWEDVKDVIDNSEKTAGFGVFLNIVIVLAGFILFIAILSLIGIYLWPLLINIPVGVYEVGAYAVSILLLLGGYLSQPFHIWFLKMEPLWFSIPGAFGFAVCVGLSYFLHTNKDQRKVYFGPGLFRFNVVIFGLSALVWGGFAVFYHDLYPHSSIPYFLAFIAVMALQAFLGFSVITMPGCLMLGWERDDAVPRSTMSSFLILAAYCWLVIAIQFGVQIPESIKLFETGAVFMGAFVYYLGLLVMSSKWYSWTDRREEIVGDDGHKVTVAHNGFNRYLMMQVITIASGILAFYLGSNYHIGVLLGVGGTFFAIYLLEKYYEIPWEGAGWAWSLLGVAVGLYFFVGFAQQNPEYFIWGIK